MVAYCGDITPVDRCCGCLLLLLLLLVCPQPRKGAFVITDGSGKEYISLLVRRGPGLQDGGRWEESSTFSETSSSSTYHV